MKTAKKKTGAKPPKRTSPAKPVARAKPRKPSAAQPKAVEKVLVLRTCAADMTAHGGFVWPEAGPVEAKDFKATAECGNGLHGLLWGEGDGELLNWAADAKWLVVEVDAAGIIEIGRKVKFRRGVVVFCGERVDATAYLAANGGAGKSIVGGTASAGDRGTASAGDRGTASAGVGGTASAGDRGTASAGDRGTASAGDRGTASAGDGGTASAGDRGTASAGDRGTASAGYGGTASAGDGGTASAGDRGTASAGDRGTASAGDRGTASAGDGGTASAGDGGCIQLDFFDKDKSCYRKRCAQVGYGGLKPGVKYSLNGKGEFVEVRA